MKTIKICPICNFNSFSPYIECLDYSVSKELFTLVSCDSCSFVFTNPRPESKTLGRYYLSESYISHTNKKTGLFNVIYQKVRKLSIVSKINLIKNYVRNGSILDLGCGTGEFLFKCKEIGWETTGIEPSEIARNQAITNLDLNVKKETELTRFKNNSFDIITLWHVLEHVEDLNDIIKNLYRILKPNGVIFIAVPNLNSYDAKYYKNFWAAYDVPIHLWHFSKKTISLIFNKNKLTLVKTKPLVFDSFYVSILSEQYKNNKPRYLTAFLIGFISNIVGIFSSKGHSSNIYIFKKDTF